MKQLTPLESRLIESATPVMDEMRDTLKAMKLESSFITIPFMCEGILDILTWDVKNQKFINIEYNVDKGKRTEHRILKLT